MRHRLVGLPLSPRWACPFAPGQAPPGREFVHGPRKGGQHARPLSFRELTTGELATWVDHAVRPDGHQAPRP